MHGGDSGEGVLEVQMVTTVVMWRLSYFEGDGLDRRRRHWRTR